MEDRCNGSLTLESTERPQPRVSIGVPVYNGERYLPLALESILAQSYRDFELIISDNGSTDGTEAICRSYAGRDPRIRYFRHEATRGVTWNFREVVLKSDGEYFLWVASDDTLHPTYLEQCVRALDGDPEAVLCYSKAMDLDEDGERLRYQEQVLADTLSSRPHQRFRQLIDMQHNCGALFGLIRASVLKRTAIHGDFADSDRCVLAELALHGRYHYIQEYLFFHHDHAQRVTRQFPSRQERMFRLHAKPPRFVFPHFRQFWEYLAAIHRAPLKATDKALCYREMLRWIGENRRRLWNDLRFFAWRLTLPLRQARSRG